jgi:2-keto-4-pentenoate hydratase
MANLRIAGARALSYLAKVETTEQDSGKMPEEKRTDAVTGHPTAAVA